MHVMECFEVVRFVDEFLCARLCVVFDDVCLDDEIGDILEVLLVLMGLLSVFFVVVVMDDGEFGDDVLVEIIGVI